MANSSGRDRRFKACNSKSRFPGVQVRLSAAGEAGGWERAGRRGFAQMSCPPPHPGCPPEARQWSVYESPLCVCFFLVH